MGKTYVDSVKYNILCDFEIRGIVDKPDIIGAVFGQSEGLLGDDLDLRELQKNGRIGRIEIKQRVNMGKTKGTLDIPSALDMVETSILAAAVESVDKVGPFEARFVTREISDTRNAKRDEIRNRARELFQRMVSTHAPESQAIAESIRTGARVANIRAFGPDKLPAGPDLASQESIIVVEGRADVVNLLKNGIKNVIGMGGAKPPKSLLDLCRKKNTTVFVDGDRGGELNARKLASLTDVAFVARAPDGKEVEELERKEIIMSLRRKVSAEQTKGRVFENGKFVHSNFQKSFSDQSEGTEEEYQQGLSEFVYGPEHAQEDLSRGRIPRTDERAPDARGRSRRGRRGGRGRNRNRDDRQRDSESLFDREPSSNRDSQDGPPSTGFSRPADAPEKEVAPKAEPAPAGFSARTADDSRTTPGEGTGFRIGTVGGKPQSAGTPEEYKKVLSELKGKLAARLLDEKGKVIKETPVRGLLETLRKQKGVHAVVFDGVVTKRLFDEAKKQGVKVLVGARVGKVEAEPGISVFSGI